MSPPLYEGITATALAARYIDLAKILPPVLAQLAVVKTNFVVVEAKADNPGSERTVISPNEACIRLKVNAVIEEALKIYNREHIQLQLERSLKLGWSIDWPKSQSPEE